MHVLLIYSQHISRASSASNHVTTPKACTVGSPSRGLASRLRQPPKKSAPGYRPPEARPPPSSTRALPPATGPPGPLLVIQHPSLYKNRYRTETNQVPQKARFSRIVLVTRGNSSSLPIQNHLSENISRQIHLVSGTRVERYPVGI